VLLDGGEGETARRRLLRECDLHNALAPILRIFHVQGIKANALSFDRKPARATSWTNNLRTYDLRINQRYTLKQNLSHMSICASSSAATIPRSATAVGRECFRAFSYDEFLQRPNASLDISWPKDESPEDL
jgi:type I restriction enzyme M protein